ncbi:MAG: hypothetical protein IPP72_18355 [Chitinophagaceae bacterium]|nr:hypothetical protein [Chitinophagaceae bacterium]
MKSCSILLALCTLLCCGSQAFGQSSKGHVYEDSSILYPQEEITAPVEVIQAPGEDIQEITDEEPEQATEFSAIDTNLVKNSNILSPDSISLLKNSKQFAYTKRLDSLLKDYRKKQQRKVNETIQDSSPSWITLFFTSMVTQFLFWSLAVFFIGFIVYKLFFSGGFFERQTAKANIKNTIEDDGSRIRDHNYDALIASAKKEQNYRLATRYLYLQLLQKLTASGAIVFAADKTNTEYLRELTGKTYTHDVVALTLNYEYVWYGEFAIDAMLFSKIETRFKNITI